MILTRVNEQGWQENALRIAENHGRLVTLWGRQSAPGSFTMYAVFFDSNVGLEGMSLRLAKGVTSYPDLSNLFPCANRMQRAMWDLLGVSAANSLDTRAWLSHGAWPDDYFPLRKEFSGREVSKENQLDEYSFIDVIGDGVHEIAVGPVHAGIIEPGHFRFSVVGEKTLRLEQRLGYAHKGVDKAFERYSGLSGVQLASRICGDSTVAYSWAYCMALESAWKWKVPQRALWLRALMLERERVANHLGDLGAIGNDAGFTFGLTQFMILKEQWIRVNKTLFKHRFIMDCVIPGGTLYDINREDVAEILKQCKHTLREVKILKGIYEEHTGLQDRFISTGKVSKDVANKLGLTGLAARASDIKEDARELFPTYPYSELDFNISGAESGDVAARVSVRFDEIFESLRLISEIAEGLPEGQTQSNCKPPKKPTFGFGWIEGWRGGIFAGLHLDQTGQIDRAHIHDPSWQNWPALDYAVIGDIVPDFPLINKSFNLSYSGHDR
ncbi:MAG: NADH-quinone oxidoreductase subunit C [Candidatus Planktophila sp.]|nr:NADH-quinone oxidoreductase subunit C [Candidatus Planktophila sp.]